MSKRLTGVNLGFAFYKLKNTVMEEKETFDFIPDDLGELYGYSAALQALSLYLQRTTKFKPENRFVDSVPILNKIAASLGVMSQKLKDYKRDDIPEYLFTNSSETEQEIIDELDNKK